MSRWFSIEKNAKKRVFCHFFQLDGVEITQNTVFWFTASNYPYLDTSTKTLPFGAFGHLWELNRRVRCRFLCFGTLRVQKQRFWVISTQSSGILPYRIFFLPISSFRGFCPWGFLSSGKELLVLGLSVSRSVGRSVCLSIRQKKCQPFWNL